MWARQGLSSVKKCAVFSSSLLLHPQFFRGIIIGMRVHLPISGPSTARCIAMAACLVFSFFAGPSPADTIVLAADEWCPFDCKAETAGSKGFMVEVAETLLTRAGHVVTFKFMRWDAAVSACRAGKVTGVVGALKGDAPDLVFPTVEQGSISQAFFTLKGSTWRYTGLQSLDSVVLGCAAGYSYCPDIDGWIAKNRKNRSRVAACTGVRPLEDLISLLKHGMITAVIEESSVFTYKANTMNLADSFRIAGYGCRPQPGYVAFSPKCAASGTYAEILSKGMVTLKNTGVLQKILARYGLSQ
jgi:polar amino acid transport system substrate-binding protein